MKLPRESISKCPNPFDWCLSTEDLWDCLEQASGKPIAEVMSSWTKQMGFPIIEVEEEQVSVTASGQTMDV